MDNGTQSRHLLASDVRVACLAVGLHEYIITLPAEYRFYRAQILSRRISRHCVLFVLIRYVSILVVIANSVGFFGKFSPATCHRLYLIAPILKVFQTGCSQLILADRTYAISQKTLWVGLLLVLMLITSTTMEFFTSIYKRQPVQAYENNCTSGNSTDSLIAWYFYVIAMIFDVTSIGISTAFLWKYFKEARTMSCFTRRLLYEGMGYIALLSAANTSNIILFHNPSQLVQSNAASIGYIFTWITSQRILINQRDASDKYGSNSSPSNPLSTPPQTVQGFYLTQEINRTSMSRSMSQRGRRFTVTSRLNRKHLSTRTESDSKDIGSISLQDAPSELEFNAVSEGYMTGIEEADELWDEEKGIQTHICTRSERTLPFRMVDVSSST